MKPHLALPRILALFVSFTLILPDLAFALRVEELIEAGLEQGIAKALNHSPEPHPAVGLEEQGKELPADVTVQERVAALLKQVRSHPASKQWLNRSSRIWCDRLREMLVNHLTLNTQMSTPQAHSAVLFLTSKLVRIIPPAEWDPSFDEALAEQVTVEVQRLLKPPAFLPHHLVGVVIPKMGPDQAEAFFSLPDPDLPEEIRRSLVHRALSGADPKEYLGRLIRGYRKKADQLQTQAASSQQPLKRPPLPPMEVQQFLLRQLFDSQRNQLHLIVTDSDLSLGEKKEQLLQIVQRLTKSNPESRRGAIAFEKAVQADAPAVFRLIHLMVGKTPEGGWASAQSRVDRFSLPRIQESSSDLPQVLIELKRFAPLLSPEEQEQFKGIFDPVMFQGVAVIDADSLEKVNGFTSQLFHVRPFFSASEIQEAYPELSLDLGRGNISISQVDALLTENWSRDRKPLPENLTAIGQALREQPSIRSSLFRVLPHLPDLGDPKALWDPFQIKLLQEIGALTVPTGLEEGGTTEERIGTDEQPRQEFSGRGVRDAGPANPPKWPKGPEAGQTTPLDTGTRNQSPSFISPLSVDLQKGVPLLGGKFPHDRSAIAESATPLALNQPAAGLEKGKSRREKAKRYMQEVLKTLISGAVWHVLSPEAIRRYPGLRVLAQEAPRIFLLDDEAHAQAIVRLMQEVSPIEGIHYYGSQEEIAAFHGHLFDEPKPLKELTESQLIPHLLEGVSLQGFLQQLFASLPRVAEAPPIDWDHFAKALSVLAAT